MKTLLGTLFTIFLLATPAFSTAADTPKVRLSTSGCDDQGNCNVYLRAAVGPASCRSKYPHWDGNTTAGKNMQTIVLAALLAEQKVIITYDSMNCYPLIGRLLQRPRVTAITIIK